MKRVVEFDLVTKIEANQRFASQAGMFAKAARTKAQREAVQAVLRSSFGSPPPKHLVQTAIGFEPMGAVGLTVRNKVAVTFTRISPGTIVADAWENLPGAFKGVKDEVAAWLGVDDAERAGIEWKPPRQEKSAPGVNRVRIEIVDLLTGEDRIVTLAETRSAGVEAERRVKRAIAKASEKKPLRDGPCDCGAKGLGLRGFHYPGAPGCAKPTVKDLHATAERLLTRPRDPGEEKSARDLAPCTTCRSPIGVACSPTVPGRTVFGVHVARARAAGLHVPDDDAAKVKPARTHGARKLAPVAQPQLPLQRAFVALPWEQPICGLCGGSGGTKLVPECPRCNGTGRAKGRVLCRAPRYDGLDEPPTTITAAVPAEHVARHGSTVVLHRQKFASVATGPCWLYATDERTETT